MSFWEQHNAAELELKIAARLPQDAPMECVECGHVGTDVLLGYCAACGET
jgi:hypothetical protein